MAQRFAKRKKAQLKRGAFLSPKKCRMTHKTILSNEKEASRVLMRIWGHDPKADINDLHTYLCPDCGGWHVGHKSYYQQKLARENGTAGIQSNLP